MDAFTRLSMHDLDQLLALERTCFSCPWSREQFELGLEQSAFYVFGIKKNEQLLAYISFYRVSEDMEILNIAVAPGCRRQGMGTRLLGLVLQMSARMGTRHCFLEVRQTNEAARRLYAKFGFQTVGRRKGYYPDTGEDAIVMKAEIG